MRLTESNIEAAVDRILSRYRQSEISFLPYSSGTVDQYSQRSKTYGTPVPLIGRAILNPTREQISAIGDGESFDIAFLFSRLQLIEKFPSAPEGEWLNNYGRATWNLRTFDLVRVAPTGQIGTKFLLTVALGKTIEGQRNP